MVRSGMVGLALRSGLVLAIILALLAMACGAPDGTVDVLPGRTRPVLHHGWPDPRDFHRDLPTLEVILDVIDDLQHGRIAHAARERTRGVAVRMGTK
jgi:hypothetical protein